MIVFKEASYVIGATASTAEEAARYASIAARAKKPLELELRSGTSVAAVRDALSPIDVPVVLAGSIADAAGLDLVLVPPDLEQFTLAAQMKKPFAAVIDPAQLAERIERLDENAELRPWHYVIRCERPSEASAALGDLFRAAPPLAHRVAGIRADASALEVEPFEDEMRECVKTFGLQLAAVTGPVPLAPYVEALARI